MLVLAYFRKQARTIYYRSAWRNMHDSIQTIDDADAAWSSSI